MPTVLYTADVVCPMTGPPLRDAGVLVRDELVASVGDASALAEEADRVRHTPGVLLPGLVNAYTCLEHADAGALARPGPHHAWVAAVAGMTAAWDDRRWKRSAHRGVQGLLRSGTTTVGDVVHRGPAVPACARAGLRGTSWLGVAHVDRTEQDAILAALGRSLGLPAPGRAVGISPQAPHLVGAGVLQALSRMAVERGVPLHVPAARSQAEVVALWSAEGPEADRLRALDLQLEWLDGGTGLSPVRYLAQLGALERGTTLAHGVWIEDNEAALLARQGVGVVCTPRADELLQVGQAPLERFAQAGVPIALGTDSPAGSPDADVLAEAAAWVRTARDRGLYFWPSPVGPIPLEEAAVRLVTIDGARTMGWGGHGGILEPGRRGDLVVVDVSATVESVYRDLVEAGGGRQVLTVIGGVRKARRSSGDDPWPSIDHELEDEITTQDGTR